MKKSIQITKTKILKALWLLFALLSALFWLPKIYNMLASDLESISQYISLDDSWDIMINGENYQNVSLDDFQFNNIGKGDEITMQRVLPDNWNIEAGVLRLHIWQTAIRMYIDDEPVYEYGFDRMADNKTVGSGLQFIDFPSDYQGKTLKIHLVLAENRAFSNYESIRIYDWANAYKILMTENRIPLFIGCFLTIFGFVTIIATIFALAFSVKYIRIFCIALFSLLMGLWTLCYYNVILIFALPLYKISLLEYLTLYLAPLPMIVYLWDDIKNLNNKLISILYHALLTIQVTATAVMLGLHAFDIVHCAATLKYMQTLIICALVFSILVELISIKLNETSNKLFLFGIVIIACCILYDLASYYNRRYFGGTLPNIRGISSIGIVIFIFILIISFYISLTQKLMQETERNFLIKSAYTDELTQIHNRRYCIEYMNKIRDAESSSYTIICFDLNNLKTVNDTLGHAKGDILIKSAADVIAETFEEHGIVARMGGDEFIAVLDTAQHEEIAKLMEQFRLNILRKNQEVEDLNMSIAYGYASSTIKEYDIDKIYQVADDRMYENKKKMKNSPNN